MSENNALAPVPPALESHAAALPSWSGWHYVWYPELGRASHLMSYSAAANLAACFHSEGATVHRHPDAPKRARLAFVKIMEWAACAVLLLALLVSIVWSVSA